MRDGDDTHAYWMGYMIQTVKDAARRTHDKSCVDALRVFVETSRLAQPNDLEALNKALGDDDPLYEGNRDNAERSAGLEAQDDALYEAARASGYTHVAARKIAGFSRCVPDTPALRLAGRPVDVPSWQGGRSGYSDEGLAFHCDPDPSCGQDGAA